MDNNEMETIIEMTCLVADWMHQVRGTSMAYLGWQVRPIKK